MSATVDPVRVLLDKEAVRDLLSRYVVLTDSNQFTARAELFTEDCRLDVHGMEVRGREATKTMRAASPEGELRPTKHYTLNAVIEVDGDEARAESYFLIVQASDDGRSIMTTAAGRYEDVLVRRGDRWLFKVRIAHRDLLADVVQK